MLIVNADGTLTRHHNAVRRFPSRNVELAKKQNADLMVHNPAIVS